MTKLLITAGDSYTTERSELISWPYWLKEYGNFDKVVNVGKGGSSNTYIFNAAFDAMEEHKDCDITLYIAWSDLMRMNFLGSACRVIECEENIIKNHFWLIDPELISELSQIVMEVIKSDNKDDIFKIYENAVNVSLRQMYMMHKYCELNNVKLYHGVVFPALGGFNTISALAREFTTDDLVSTQNKIQDTIKETNVYYKALEESSNFMGFKFVISNYIIAQGLEISKQNTHPNEDGHKHLAEVFNKFMKDGERLETDYTHREVFVYD